MRKIGLGIVLLLAALASYSCGSSNLDVAKEGTLQAISNEVRATGSAQALQQLSPDDAAGTAQAEATVFQQSVVETQAALSSLGADAQTATAAAFEPIIATLPKYDVDPSLGRMGWVHPPVTLEVTGYHEYKYVNYFISTLAADFVVSADITVDSIGNTSGCGFVLRSDGNERALNQYLVILSRIASGQVIFATMSKGEVVTGRNLFPSGKDKSFDWQNNATNRLTVVGRGNHFWIYTNDTLIGDVDPSAPPPLPVLPTEPPKPANSADPQAMAEYLQKKAEYDASVLQAQAEYSARVKAFKNADTVFDRGFVAMVALSESGRTTKCSYDNAWLWLIE